MKENILPYLEWEVLREPISISRVCDIKELPKGQKEIVINRDDGYKLRGLLYSKDVEFFATEKKEIPGSFVEHFDIQGSDQGKLKHFTLKSCFIGDRLIRQEDKELLCEVDLHIQGVKTRYTIDTEGVWLTEWYINGPRDSFVFCNPTKRSVQRTFFRERSAPKDEKVDSIELDLETSSFGLDFLRIKACGFQFLVTKVPNGIGPDWSSNIGIEYRKDWGRIPNVDEREKISELCSFIFGRQLLLVGYTIYDKDGNIVEEYACNPWDRNPKSLCSSPDIPPIRIGDYNSRGKAEDLISQLLPAYYELQNPLHFKEALWLYWISRNMPIGTNLPILAAAVETIMNGWFDYKKTSRHGVYMKKDEFESLLHEEIEGIKSKLKSKPHGDNVINRIQDAYNMSITDRFRFFFEEIKLVIDKYEWDAINARHDIAHGRIEFSKTEWRTLIQHAQTYETLIHKILLRLLGYSGSYIDRSIVGWKDKQLV